MAYFKVKDLMINVADERLGRAGRGSKVGLCSADQPTHLTCTIHSPVMQAVRLTDYLKVAVGQVVRDPDKTAQLDKLTERVGSAVVAGAVQGGVGMPDPTCGGTSYETIPTIFTPVIREADFLTVAHLPAIKQRLKEAMAAVEQIEAQHAPQAEEVGVLVEHLEAAVKSLKG